MNDSTLIVACAVVVMVLIFAGYCLSMYLGKFPFVKTSTEVNLEKNSFKANLEVNDNKDERA